MGTRQRNHLVSATVARRQLPPVRGFPGNRSEKPHARDPPYSRPHSVVPPLAVPPPGENLPEDGKEAMRQHRLFPKRRTREASPVTASYVTR